MSEGPKLPPCGVLSFHWLADRITDTLWLWGTLEMGTTSDLFAIWNSTLIPGYRTAPMGAAFFFFCHISFQTSRNVNEKPLLLPHLTFAHVIGQKRASVPPRVTRGPAAWCSACLMLLTPTFTHPHQTDWEETQLSVSEWVWMDEWAAENAAGNNNQSWQELFL